MSLVSLQGEEGWQFDLANMLYLVLSNATTMAMPARLLCELRLEEWSVSESVSMSERHSTDSGPTSHRRRVLKLPEVYGGDLSDEMRYMYCTSRMTAILATDPDSSVEKMMMMDEPAGGATRQRPSDESGVVET